MFHFRSISLTFWESSAYPLGIKHSMEEPQLIHAFVHVFPIEIIKTFILFGFFIFFCLVLPFGNRYACRGERGDHAAGAAGRTPTDGSRKGHGSERAEWGSTGGSERRDLGNPKTGSCLLICVYSSWLLIFADVCWCLLTCGLVDSSLGWFWVGP